MSNTELKPCPFCGGEAKYCIEVREFSISRFVTCTKCGIETRRKCLNTKDAIKTWNTRKPMDKIVKQLKKAESVKLYGSNNSGNYLIPLKDAIDIVRKGGIDG